MLAAKSFEKTSDPAQLQRWLHILADELAARMRTDAEQYRRHPRNLVMHYRCGWTVTREQILIKALMLPSPHPVVPLSTAQARASCRGGPLVNGNYTQGRSRSCAMPRFGKAGPQTDVIADAGWKLFKSAPDALPCSQLSLSAAEFADAPVAAGKSIARFFAAVPEGPSAEQPQDSALATGSAVPASGVAAQRGGPPAGQRQQPRWERVKGTIAHSFARVPAASATRGDGDVECADEADCAHSDTTVQNAHVTHADDPQPENSRCERLAADGSAALTTVSLVWPNEGINAVHPLPTPDPGVSAPEQPVTLANQARSQSEPSRLDALAQRSVVPPLQRPLGRSRTATAAEVLARRAAFEAAAESAIAACMRSPRMSSQAGGDGPPPAAGGQSEVHHTSSTPAGVAPIRSRPQQKPLVHPARAPIGEDAVDLSSIDAREQSRILQEIARRKKATQPALAGAGAKRRSGGRSGPRTAKRLNQDPRQLGMERFMGSN